MRDNSLEIKRRKDWIDALRAIAMILVVYGHQVPEWNEYFVFTSPVKICLFFAISGYLLNTGKSWKEFLTSLLKHLVIPWAVLSLIQPILLLPLRGVDSLKVEVIAVLTGHAKWYMPCCIIAEIIWYTFNKIFKSRIIPVFIMSYLAFFVGIILCKHEILNFWMINRALTVQPYLLIGAIYKIGVDKIRDRAGAISIIGIVLYIGLGVLSLVLYPGESLDVHTASYYNLFICHAMIWIGIIAMFIILEYGIKKYQNWIIILGKDTLVVYLFHSLLITAVVKLMSLIGISNNRFIALLVTAIVCAMCCLLTFGINRFCPALLGGKKKTFKSI